MADDFSTSEVGRRTHELDSTRLTPDVAFGGEGKAFMNRDKEGEDGEEGAD